MKLLLIIFTLMMTGCQTALVYTGEVRCSASSRLEIELALEKFYRSRGFTPAPSATGSGYAPREWHLVRGKRLVVWLGHTLQEDMIEIRIVPQSGANEASREVAVAIRAFMEAQFPKAVFDLVEKSELDLFR